MLGSRQRRLRRRRSAGLCGHPGDRRHRVEPPRFNQNRLIIFELQVIGAYNYNDDGFGAGDGPPRQRQVCRSVR